MRQSDDDGDPFDLERFVKAQDPVFEEVRGELRRGRKTGHWMWFVFPQIAGLGTSATARRYAISSRDEAAAYLRHPVLGPRLRECTRLVTAVQGSTAHGIFGYPDNLKFRSSLTLFAHATADSGVFTDALRKFFAGEPDPMTLARLLPAAGTNGEVAN
jgi:uncharacterized protein (DUF1810 family)